MSWQGYVRKLAPGFDRVIVATTAGLEPLYADFCSEFITHDVPLGRDCWRAINIGNQARLGQHATRIRGLETRLAADGYAVTAIRHASLIPVSKQVFLPYGTKIPSAGYDVIFHARYKKTNTIREQDCHNWDISKWDQLFYALQSRGLRVAFIGSRSQSLCPAGAVDLRGMPLEELMTVLRSSHMAAGPSSGPMHLASLCGTPHLVWTHSKYNNSIRATNRKRYESLWNPLNTPCSIYDETPDIAVDTAIERVLEMHNVAPGAGTPADPPVVAGMICYENSKEAIAHIKNLVAKFSGPVVAYDNSEKDTALHALHGHAGRVTVLGTGQNVGCTRSRNAIYSHVLATWPSTKFLGILDQDIEVRSGWLDMLLRVMRQRSDCGIAAFPKAYRGTRVYTGGVVSEVASMCNLHRMAALAEVTSRWGEPFDSRFTIHKFDSLACQRHNQLGWRTVLCMDGVVPGTTWETQPCGFVHHHPHQGVRRNPRCSEHIAFSKNLYAAIQKAEGWTPWDPAKAGLKVIAEMPTTPRGRPARAPRWAGSIKKR